MGEQDRVHGSDCERFGHRLSPDHKGRWLVGDLWEGSNWHDPGTCEGCDDLRRQAHDLRDEGDQPGPIFGRVYGTLPEHDPDATPDPDEGPTSGPRPLTP